jgi:hypothetical protein
MRITHRVTPAVLCIWIATWALSFAARADEVAIRADAPDRHVVRKGDTLWDISAKFLKDPWKWPQVWGLNKEQIKNPHLIYPGDVVLLGPDGRLSLERGMRTVKLSPQARSEPIVMEQAGIPSVPYQAIAPLLNRGGVTAPGGLENAPYILGASDERLLTATTDKVYATAGESYTNRWQIVRLGQAFKDPDSGEILGYELQYVGEADTLQAGSPQLIRISRVAQEVLERDRLVPHPGEIEFNYAPHAPDKPVAAKVLSALGGVAGAGPYTTVVLNKGRQDGLEPGHVLGIFKAGRSIADPKCLRAEKLAFLAGGLDAKADCQRKETDDTALPERRIGLTFVYRVFDRVAYGLVMGSEEPVYVRDVVKNP